MIYVVATIELVEGKRDEFLQAFHELMPKVHAERGCLEYAPAIDQETAIPAQPEAREDVVIVMEKWESVPALEAHLIAPHMNEYRSAVKPLVKGTRLQILRPA